jgi:hypothetical protein
LLAVNLPSGPIYSKLLGTESPSEKENNRRWTYDISTYPILT